MAKKADKLICVEKVAEMTCLAVKTILAGKCGTGELVRVKVGKKLLFSANDVQRWIERRVKVAREEMSEQTKREPSNVISIRSRLSRQEIDQVVTESSAPAEAVAVPPDYGDAAEPSEGIGAAAK